MKINLASNRLAFILIGTLFLLILISVIIPQEDLAKGQILDLKEYLGDNYKVISFLGLDRIYFTPLFFVTIGLLAVNILFGNIRRFKLIYKTERTLLRMRHLGSIIFHLSIIVILSGIILNYLYKNNSVFALTEGQSADDSITGHIRNFEGPLYNDEYGRFSIKLNKIYTEYQVGDDYTDAADVSVIPVDEMSIVNDTIRANNPLKWDGLEFHLGSKIGYSPNIVVDDTLGDKIFSKFMRVASRTIDDKITHFDHYSIPGSNIIIEIEVLVGEEVSSEESYYLKVEKDNILMYDDVLAKGESAAFDEYVLTIPQLRRWCYIEVIKSPFLNMVFFGFWSALAGMTIGFIPRVMGQRRVK